jgi:MerT mercuric transport protein
MAKRLFRASSLFGAAAASVTSTAASICCIGPLAIALLGVNGAILAAAFKPYRFYLLGASFVLLVGAFWSVYSRPRARDSGACPMPRGRWSTIILWTGATLWVAALIILYLANRFWLKGGVVL